VIWPLAAGAQARGGPARRIGVLISRSPVAPVFARALREGLESLGWAEGKNIQFEYRWPTGQVDRPTSDAVRPTRGSNERQLFNDPWPALHAGSGACPPGDCVARADTRQGASRRGDRDRDNIDRGVP